MLHVQNSRVPLLPALLPLHHPLLGLQIHHGEVR